MNRPHLVGFLWQLPRPLRVSCCPALKDGRVEHHGAQLHKHVASQRPQMGARNAHHTSELVRNQEHFDQKWEETIRFSMSTAAQKKVATWTRHAKLLSKVQKVWSHR